MLLAQDDEKQNPDRFEEEIASEIRRNGAGRFEDDKEEARSPGSVDQEKKSPLEVHGSETEEDRENTISSENQGDFGPIQTATTARSQQRRRSSVFTRTTFVIPRSERRGLFGRFAMIPEIERPHEYKDQTKWMITFIVAMAGMGGPLGSSIFYPALSAIEVDLNTTATITNLSVAFYMLSMSIFPLWWSSFSETLGRRTIYLMSFSLFVVFSVLSAVSINIAMLIVMRILGGGASASVQAVGAGTIADIWETKERGRAMGIFYLGPLMGPLLAPILGGALAQGFGWRSTMWFLAIYGGVVLLGIFVGLPETLKRKPIAPTHDEQRLRRVSTAQSVKIHTQRAAHIFKQLIVDPLHVLLYLRYPPVLLSVYSASIAFMSLFVLNISIQSTFSKAPYGYSTIIVGLLYLPPSLGYIVASTLGGRWLDRIMVREAERAGRYDADGKLVFLPEDRMRENMWVAATLYPAALIWYGWAAENSLPWIVPAIANFFFGCGSMLVFGAVTTMLTEFMPHRSSSGVAINNFVRNIFSCVGAIVTQPLLNVLGNGWLCTMVGLLAWVTGNVAIFALKRWGPAWRASMDMTLNQS